MHYVDLKASKVKDNLDFKFNTEIRGSYKGILPLSPLGLLAYQFLMSDANDIQPTPEDNVQDLLKQLFRQMEIQQTEIRQLKAERADNPGTSPGRVKFRQTRPTTLKLYDELLKYYPAIDTPDFYSAELPKNHSVFDWSEFHYTEGMEYKAPPVLQHAEVSLSSSSKQHDQDLATIQGWMANTTRIFDSLAHEIVEMQAGDTEIGERVFECLNI
ncbi:hypothetical protein BGW42_007726, partial [Actinomortierella wolfii]